MPKSYLRQRWHKSNMVKWLGNKKLFRDYLMSLLACFSVKWARSVKLMSLSPHDVFYTIFSLFVATCLLQLICAIFWHLTVLCIQLSFTFCQSVSVLVYLFICSFFFFCLPLNNVLCHCDDLSDRLCFVFAVCDNHQNKDRKKKKQKTLWYRHHSIPLLSLSSLHQHNDSDSDSDNHLFGHSIIQLICFPFIGQNWPLPHNWN